MGKRRKIIIEDIEAVVENFENNFATYYGVDDTPLRLIKAIYSIYREYVEAQEDDNIDLAQNRPEILRSDVIKIYTGKEPTKFLEEEYRTYKGKVNKTLKKLIQIKTKGKSLNPKCLVLETGTRGKGEKANYFVQIETPMEIKEEETGVAEKSRNLETETAASSAAATITVPHPSELFQSREKDLAEVLELINDNKIIAVTGPPGQGKTEFVRAIAHTLADQKKYPDGIFWASDREDEKEYPLKDLESIFNAVLKGKNVSDVEKIHSEEKKKQVTKIMESGRALLILDNFETVYKVEEIIFYLQKLSPKARLLIATRDDLAPNLARKYTLTPLSDNGISLFWNLLEKAEYFDDAHKSKEEEKDWAKEICQLLDGHPLSLVLTAGNAAYNSLEKVAQRLQTNPYKILQSRNRPPGTPEGLWKSIDLSLARLDHEVHELFLKLSLFFAPVSFEAIEAVFDEDDPEDLLIELEQRNLLNRDRRGRYFFLPVLRMVSRHLLKRSDLDLRDCHKKAADYFKKQEVPESIRAIDHLEWLFKKGNDQAGREIVSFLLDIEKILFKSGNWNLDEEKLKQTIRVANSLDLKEGEVELLTRLGWLRHHKWDLTQAEELHQKALKICEKLQDQSQIAYQWKHLGWVYSDQGKLDKAKDVYKKSLKITKKEKDYHNQADIWSALGAIYRRQEKLYQAERAILYALHLAARSNRKNSDILCRIWSNLASLYSFQGKFNEAENFLKKSLQHAEKNDDLNRQVDNTIALGQVYLNQERFDEAEQLLKRLLSAIDYAIKRHDQKTVDGISERVHGYQIYALENLGYVYRRQGNLDKAKKFITDSLKSAEESNNIPMQFNSLKSLGQIHLDQGELKEAEHYFKKMLIIAEQSVNLREQSATNYFLGQFYRMQGKFIEAEKFIKKALYIHQQRKNIKGQSNSWTNLGIIYRDAKKFAEAEAAHKNSQILKDQFNSNSGKNWHKLGLIYNDQGKLNEAELAFKKALNIYEKRDFSPCLVKEWQNLALVCHQQGKDEEAKQAIEKSLSFAERFDGLPLPRFQVDILCDLGLTCIKLREVDKGGEILKKIIDAKKDITEIFGQGIYLVKMGMLYEGTGNTEQAIGHTEKALEIFKNLGNVPKVETTQATLNRLQRKN